MYNYAELNDTQLCELALDGNRASEEELVSRYMFLVRACARPLFLAGGDSEDLIQEGMLGLLSAVRQFDPGNGTSFSTFAEHCIKMRLFSAVKTASRLKHLPLNAGVSLDRLSEEASEEVSCKELSYDSPEEMILARESEKELREAFSRCLSAMENKVLSLYLDGLSYRDIAGRLGKDEKAIDNAVQRIRGKLARNTYFGDIS